MLTMFERMLDELYISVTRRRYFQLFAVFNRVLLGVAFIPPSITKILNRPFTILPETDPVGAYFIALYNTGVYYQFLGWAQLTAALLLLFPRTAHIGAFLFFPIIANIAVLTASVGFKGTWLITLLMSFAALYLVAWEYDRIKPLIFHSRKDRTVEYRFQFWLIPLFFGAGGLLFGAMMYLFAFGNLSSYGIYAMILTGMGLLFGSAIAWHFRFMRVGTLNDARNKDII